MNVHITKHAEVRMQQRGVSRDALGLLMKYGRRARAGKGAEIVYFDKRALSRLRRARGQNEAVSEDKQLKSYAICKDDVIVTVGKLYRRVRR